MGDRGVEPTPDWSFQMNMGRADGSLGGMWGSMIIGTAGDHGKMEGTDYAKEGCHSLTLVKCGLVEMQIQFYHSF